MHCFILKGDCHHLVSPISVYFSLVRIVLFVLFVQTVSVKIIKIYYSFDKKNIDNSKQLILSYIYIHCNKWSSSSAWNIFGTRILTVFNRLQFQSNII